MVTITSDAVLRVWEVHSKNRSSYENPTLSIDLKKLANATSASQDLRASAFGATTPFSPDTAELEPAGACFGGSGTPGEDPWSAMTLWVATKEGDAYALCPLLPSRWQISDKHISSLVLAGVAHAAEQGSNDTETSRWVLNVADQEPILRKGNFGMRQASLYYRPEQPSSIPKLQGPYVLIPQPDEDDEYENTNEPSDILVVDLAASPDASFEDDDLPSNDHWQSMPSLVALLATDGRVYLALNLERVEPHWLPQKGLNEETANGWKLPQSDFRTLIVTETIRLQEGSLIRMCTSLTRDCNSPYSFFVTLSGGIAFISLDSWLKPLRDELLQAIDEKTGLRLDLLFSQFTTLTDYPIIFRNASATPDGVAAPLVLNDSDIGYFLLASANGLAYGANMDIGDDEQRTEEHEAADEAEAGMNALTFHEPEAREPYQPPQEFYAPSKLLSIENDLSAYHRSLLKEQVKLSPMSLEVLTKAHRAVSAETNHISIAVADLFRRCKRLLEEFQAQIREVDELTSKINGLQNSNSSGSALNERLQKCQQKSQELAERRRKLARNMARAGQRELSDKEKAWQAEVEGVAGKIKLSEAEEELSDEVLWQRFEQVKSLREDLITDAKKAVDKSKPGEKAGDGQLAVPTEVRKQRLAQVDVLLETESALIEAVRKRLEQLGPAEV